MEDIEKIIKIIFEDYGIDLSNLGYESLYGVRERFLEKFFEKFSNNQDITRFFNLMTKLLDLLCEQERNNKDKDIDINISEKIDKKLKPENVPKNK